MVKNRSQLSSTAGWKWILSFVLQVIFSSEYRGTEYNNNNIKNHSFHFKLTMTLGIILLFLIEAHICDVKEFIDGTCHIHITHPKTRTYYTQSTETHYQIRTIIIAMHTTCVLAFFLFFSFDFLQFFHRDESLFFIVIQFDCSTGW